MRRISFLALAIMFLSGLALPFASTPAGAEDLTPEQTALIKANCTSIKNSLNQLHASDALLRVNRGQVYESMNANLMSTFNDRLASNKLDNKAMTTVTSSYTTQLNTFRADYIAYEQKLSSVIKIDCSSQPNTFHTALMEARTLRGKVHSDVTKLHALIDDYRLSVNDFLLNYERVAE